MATLRKLQQGAIGIIVQSGLFNHYLVQTKTRVAIIQPSKISMDPYVNASVPIPLDCSYIIRLNTNLSRSFRGLRSLCSLRTRS